MESKIMDRTARSISHGPWISALLVPLLGACVGNIGDVAGVNPGPGGAGNSSGGGTTGGGGIGPGLGMGVGGSGGVVGPPVEPPVDMAIDPGLAPLRRLTNEEYGFTVRDLLQDTSGIAKGFIGDIGTGPQYDSIAAAQARVAVALANQYMDAASQLAQTAVATATKLAALLPCKPEAAGEEACAKTFIATFGKRAYRRKLDAGDTDILFTVYQAGRTGGDFALGIRTVIQTMLQSPNFLYRVEFPRAPKGIESVADYEMASRLSYLLWRSMPDEALFQAAEDGKLRTKEGITVEATRMMADAKAKQTMSGFYRQWFKLYKIESAFKDATAHPEWTSEIPGLMKKEADLLFEDLLWTPGSDITTFLTASHTFLNQKLAQFYGITGVTGDQFKKVELDTRYKGAGVVRLGAVMAGLAHPVTTAPFVRAKFLLDMVTCQNLPDIPPAVDQSIPKPMAAQTTRGILENKTSPADCQRCHSVMNPYAWSLENFDAVGKWRTKENNAPVVTTGAIAAGELAGDVVNAADLLQRMSRSQMYKDCAARQVFRYGMGHLDAESDAPVVNRLSRQLAANGNDLKQVLLGLTQSDTFRFRRVEEGI